MITSFLLITPWSCCVMLMADDGRQEAAIAPVPDCLCSGRFRSSTREQERQKGREYVKIDCPEL